MEQRPEELKNIGVMMSNFDYEIEPGTKNRLKSEKVYCGYAGWNFYGTVWFDGRFKCQVKQYKRHVDTVEARTLKELMKKVSAKYGQD